MRFILTTTNNSPLTVSHRSSAVRKSKGTIVGVVKDFHNKSFHENIAPICITSATMWYNNCAVRINPAHLSATLGDIEATWKKTFPDQIYEYDFLDEQIARFYEMDNVMLKAALANPVDSLRTE